MSEERNQEERSFTVVDRRHGREASEERREDQPPGGSEAAARREPPPAAPPPPGPESGASGPEPEREERREAGGATEGRRHAESERAMPGIDFATFVISLSTSALHHLGLIAEREGAEPPPPNLPMARQTIDILEILQEKTRGNLDEEEARLLEGLLYELRMRFVEVQRGS